MLLRLYRVEGSDSKVENRKWRIEHRELYVFDIGMETADLAWKISG